MKSQEHQEAIKSEDWHAAAATQDKLFGLKGWWYACGNEGAAGGHMHICDIHQSGAKAQLHDRSHIPHICPG